MQDPTSNPHHHALLANAAWVQGLARRLVADAHCAEDVAQDVLATALEKPPAFDSGSAPNRARLRRWLGGVTRHLASRATGRASERRLRESAATGSPVTDGDNPTERLELHRRLVEVVLSLAEPYRSTVVLRFFDGLEVREIATRQDVELAAVRQRLSRAMQLLRHKLDREYRGDRGAWCVALAGLFEVQAPVVVGSALGKVLAAAAVLLIFAGAGRFAWLESRPVPAVQDDGVLSARPPVNETHGGLLAATAEDLRAALPLEAAANPALHIQVLDQLGRIVSGAQVHGLYESQIIATRTTDAEGVAHFAEMETGGFIVAQGALGPPQLLKLKRFTGSHSVTLGLGTSLSGWLYEDGHGPTESIVMSLSSLVDPLEGLGTSVQELLADAGISLATREFSIAVDGQFEVQHLPAEWAGELQLPSTHWFKEAPVDARVLAACDRLQLASAQEGLSLRRTKLSILRGRLVDEQRGAALPNAQVAALPDFGEHGSTISTTSTDAEGRFVIGMATGVFGLSPWLTPGARPGERPCPEPGPARVRRPSQRNGAPESGLGLALSRARARHR